MPRHSHHSHPHASADPSENLVCAFGRLRGDAPLVRSAWHADGHRVGVAHHARGLADPHRGGRAQAGTTPALRGESLAVRGHAGLDLGAAPNLPPRAKAHAQAVSTAIEHYRQAQGHYPSSLSSLDIPNANDWHLHYTRREDGRPLLHYPSTAIPFDTYVYDFSTLQWEFRPD